MNLRWLAAAIFLVGAAPAAPAQWWVIGTVQNSEASTVAYLDRSLITNVGDGTLQAWVLEVYDRPLASGAIREAQHVSFDCARQTYAILERHAIDASGKEVAPGGSASTSFSPVRPNGVEGHTLPMVCGQPSASQVRIVDPFAHAAEFFRAQQAAQHPAAQPPAAAAAPSRSEQWLGIGRSQAPDGLAFMELGHIRPAANGTTEAWVLELFRQPLAGGVTRIAAEFVVDCRTRRYDLSFARAEGESGPFSDLQGAQAATVGIAPESLASGVITVACGQRSGQEIQVADPFDYAEALYHRTYAVRGGNQPPASSAESGRQSGDDRSHMSVGTAFFVGPAGYALTSNHVVAGAARLGCRTGDGRMHQVQIVRASQTSDLALLRIDARPSQYLGFAPRGSVHAGDRVFTFGFGAPNFLGLAEPRFTEGTVSAMSGPGGEDSYMQISVPVQPGNSGGPLVNEAGQLVGIIAAQAEVDAFMQSEGTLPQSINWAVKADYAIPLMPAAPAAPRRTREQAIAVARGAICLVVAEGAGG